jgi:hypothetical protein
VEEDNRVKHAICAAAGFMILSAATELRFGDDIDENQHPHGHPRVRPASETLAAEQFIRFDPGRSTAKHNCFPSISKTSIVSPTTALYSGDDY